MDHLKGVHKRMADLEKTFGMQWLWLLDIKVVQLKCFT